MLMNGTDVVGMPVQKRNVAMVYQQFINYPSMTVYENIASPMRAAGKLTARDRPAGARSRGADEAVARCSIASRWNLSGGQQQRCALARALVKNAELVLLDEPLANLDYKLREELRVEIPKIFAESGAIFVYATTEPEEALLLGGAPRH
jgi:glycerol transport system ATP-binding protein